MDWGRRRLARRLTPPWRHRRQSVKLGLRPVRLLGPLFPQLAADAVGTGGVQAGVVALLTVLSHEPGAALTAVAGGARETGPAVPAGEAGAFV